MKKRFTLGTVLALMLLVAVTTVIIAYSLVQGKLEEGFRLSEAQRQEYKEFIDARNAIYKSYVGPIDDDMLLDGAISGMVDALGDKYSHYLNAEEYALYKNSTDNKYTGIGITASMSPEGDILVNEVYDGSSAMECAIEPMDRIVAIEGQKVTDMGYQVALNAMSGAENTKVKLTVLRSSDGKTYDVAPLRRLMDVQAVYSEILAGQNIGYIRIRNFDANVDKDFKEALDHLLSAKVSAVIFDVRYNPGGQVEVMCPMLDALLPEGLLIKMREKNGNETERLSGPDEVSIPMAVLINSDSYSAAEFFAAALQEYGKAVLVGEPTTGKGYAQKPILLNDKSDDKSAIILSTMEYFTPKGKSLSGVGLTPDYPLSLTETEKKNFHFLTHERDRQLQKAIEVLKAKITIDQPPVQPSATPGTEQTR